MANSLYQAIIDKLRGIQRAPLMPGKRVVPGQPEVVPFAPGRVYKTMYTNYKHDPRPLIFIMSSNMFHTHAINVNYLGGLQNTLLRIIMNMRNSNLPLTGMVMYQFLKMRAPSIPKIAYRVYFTRYLRGKLVSDGVSQIPSPDTKTFVVEPFVRALNNLIRPRLIGRVRMTQKEADLIKSQMEEAGTKADQIIIGKRIRR